MNSTKLILALIITVISGRPTETISTTNTKTNPSDSTLSSLTSPDSLESFFKKGFYDYLKGDLSKTTNDNINHVIGLLDNKDNKDNNDNTNNKDKNDLNIYEAVKKGLEIVNQYDAEKKDNKSSNIPQTHQPEGTTEVTKEPIKKEEIPQTKQPEDIKESKLPENPQIHELKDTSKDDKPSDTPQTHQPEGTTEVTKEPIKKEEVPQTKQPEDIKESKPSETPQTHQPEGTTEVTKEPIKKEENSQTHSSEDTSKQVQPNPTQDENCEESKLPSTPIQSELKPEPTPINKDNENCEDNGANTPSKTELNQPTTVTPISSEHISTPTPTPIEDSKSSKEESHNTPPPGEKSQSLNENLTPSTSNNEESITPTPTSSSDENKDEVKPTPIPSSHKKCKVVYKTVTVQPTSTSTSCTSTSSTPTPTPTSTSIEEVAN